MDIASRRLHNQHITRPLRGSPADLVMALGAVQAQEYPFAKWALALRLGAKATDAEIDAAVDRGDILRTHVLRPTWHFVAAPDIVWIQQLTGPRVHARLATYIRHFGIEKALVKAASVMERALGGRHYLTRPELRARLASAGIALSGTPLALVIMNAELEQVICSGPRAGKQFTYALVSERAAGARALPRDEALAELTRRYLESHGPATIRDFVWWSSLTTAEARRGVDMIKARRLDQDGRTYWMVDGAKAVRAARGPQVHLLPIYDEFLVAYRDRIAVPHGPGSLTFGPMKHAMVIDGVVAGTWRTDRIGEVTVTPVRRLTVPERAGIEARVGQLEKFFEAVLTLNYEGHS